jgi:hypothetical protein
VYEELLPQCDGLYLTYITKDYEGDVLLPPFEHLFTLAEVLETSGDLEFRRYEQG